MEEKKEAAAGLEQLTSAQEIEQAIEAILYAAGYPMRYDKLAEVLGLTVKDVKTMVKEMSAHFAAEDTHHGIQLLLYPTTCQLATKEKYAPYIREALGPSTATAACGTPVCKRGSRNGRYSAEYVPTLVKVNTPPTISQV